MMEAGHGRPGGHESAQRAAGRSHPPASRPGPSPIAPVVSVARPGPISLATCKGIFDMTAWIGNRDPQVVMVRCPFCNTWIAEGAGGNPFLRECATCDVADQFSDVYKSVHGVRPRGFTIAYAREWLARWDATNR